MSLYYQSCSSPLGNIYVIADEKNIVRVEITEEGFEKFSKEKPEMIEGSKLCQEAVSQLTEYFSGKRREFDLPIDVDNQGTGFQQTVWKALLEIPYGEIRCYKDIAEAINNPKACQAIGQANRCNRIPIIIPCHRVRGKNGKLIGYAGSRTDIQEKLLKLEGIL